MNGLEAISAANGWVMAGLGACIVFTGLTVLTIIISQLHKVISFFEGGSGTLETDGAAAAGIVEIKRATIAPPPLCPSDIGETARAYEPLIAGLEEASFTLVSLHQAARENDFPHPHITITNLREAGVLVALGEGRFTWNDDYDAIGRKAADSSPAAPVQPAAVPLSAATPAAAAPASQEKPAEAPIAPPVESEGTPIKAPMPGMIVKFEKKVGDDVVEGETVLLLEAMKMENALPAPVSGTVKSIHFESGDSVAKGDVLCVIG